MYRFDPATSSAVKTSEVSPPQTGGGAGDVAR